MRNPEAIGIAVLALLAVRAPLGAIQALPADGQSPSPAPVVAREGLREIGHVHAKTAFCEAIYDHGGLATSAVLAGDSDLNEDIDWLNKVDLDSTELARQHGLQELAQRYRTLRARSRAAIDESVALRGVAASASTPEQKQALVEFANAIGGALHRQVVLADTLSRFMIYTQAHGTVSEQQRDEDNVAVSIAPRRPYEHSMDPRDRVPPTLSEMAESTAVELTERRAPQLDDEVRAAKQIPVAFSNCTPPER